ncbi:MAG: heavy metal transporter [Chloroflexi bacterium RBG_16_47_49]|nr:MAG: heavy metal transporter [Chloroflexi bacterium RBG_16_47_49]
MATKVTYSIPGIHCGHCVHTIQSEVIDMPGIKSVRADQMMRSATIEFEPPASEEKIKALLASIDYPVAG